MFCFLLSLFFLVNLPLNSVDHDPDSFSTESQVLSQCLDHDVDFIHVYFVDLEGEMREFIISHEMFQDVIFHGLEFNGSLIPGCSDPLNSDMHLKIDLNTFCIHSLECGDLFQGAHLFADVYVDGETPYLADSRYLLKQSCAKVRELELSCKIGPEIEFFLLKQNQKGKWIPFDDKSYCALGTSQKYLDIRFKIIKRLQENNIYVEKFHHEASYGQYECSLPPQNPVEAADQIVLLRHIIKQVAKENGLVATFKPKPFLEKHGSGLHTNISLFDLSDQKNLFHDSDEGLSFVAKNFMSGILYRMREGTLLLNSSENSFKRFVPGYEAPFYISWGYKNRGALIRVPQIFLNRPHRTRIEVRSPDALCNPYLAFSFLIESGLQGIVNKEDVSESIEETLAQRGQKNMKVLPLSLKEALDCFSRSYWIKKTFPSVFVEEFTKLKSEKTDCKIK